MAAGRRLSARAQRRIRRAVALAEARSGVQLCVYVGPVAGETRAHAEALFDELALGAGAGVLLLVAPAERRFEIVTSAAAARRIGDRECALAATALRAACAVGDVAGGVCDAVRLLARAAGPGTESGTELPDLVTPHP